MADWREVQKQRDQAQREHPEYVAKVSPGYRKCQACSSGILEDAPAFAGKHDGYWYCPSCANGAPTAAPVPAKQARHCWECGHPLDGSQACPRCGERAI